MGLLTPDEAYLLECKSRAKVGLAPKVITTEEELRTLYRKQWTELTEQNPSANRSKLMAMAPACHKWLRENDVEWYEENSPPAKYTNFDWGRKDIETLGKMHRAYETILNADGKPRWISRHALIEATGVFNLSNRKALEKMPQTAFWKRFWSPEKAGRNER